VDPVRTYSRADPAGTYSGPGASAPTPAAAAGTYIPVTWATSAAAEMTAFDEMTTLDRCTRVWKRVAELTALFTRALGDIELTPLRQMKIDRAAQLTALAELARGRFMRNGDGTLDDIVRLERKADSAVRALGIVESKPKPPSIADIVARHKLRGASA
jgi:hypothetical protein